MRLLVTGGRDYADAARLRQELEGIDARNCIDLLIFGDCPTGADRLALDWALEREVPYWRFDAEWNRFGKSAGPLRNARMVRDGVPTHCVAFPGGPGTADCVAKAIAAGVVMKVVEDEKPTDAGRKAQWQFSADAP